MFIVLVQGRRGGRCLLQCLLLVRNLIQQNTPAAVCVQSKRLWGVPSTGLTLLAACKLIEGTNAVF